MMRLAPTSCAGPPWIRTMRVSPRPIEARYTGSPATEVSSSSFTFQILELMQGFARTFRAERGEIETATHHPGNVDASFSPRVCRANGERVRGKHAAERPRHRAEPEDEAENGVPALLAPVRDCCGGCAIAVSLGGRVHPDADRDSE